MLAIVASGNDCVDEFLRKVPKETCKAPIGTKIYKCNYKGHDFLVMVTGYGKLNIGASLMYLTQNYPVKVLFNIGSAGSISDTNEIFCALIPKGVLSFDVDFTQIGYFPAQIPGEKKHLFEANEDLIDCAKRACDLCGNNYSNDFLASSDMFVCDNRLAMSIRREYAAGAVDCEASCVGQFAYQNGIAFVCVKVISNFANNNAVRQFRMYDEQAKINVQKIAYKFLKEYYE